MEKSSTGAPAGEREGIRIEGPDLPDFSVQFLHNL